MEEAGETGSWIRQVAMESQLGSLSEKPPSLVLIEWRWYKPLSNMAVLSVKVSKIPGHVASRSAATLCRPYFNQGRPSKMGHRHLSHTYMAESRLLCDLTQQNRLRHLLQTLQPFHFPSEVVEATHSDPLP